MGLNREQIGVQAHCLRREMSSDFPGTLQRLQTMGFENIELCSFAGCAGNPWGDFGELAEWRPDEVRAALQVSGLSCISTHVTVDELSAGHIDSTIQWANGIGAPVVVLAGMPEVSGGDLESSRGAFAKLRHYGERLRDNGLAFAYHTQIDVWKRIDGRLLANWLFEETDPEYCLIELDPSGALVHGSDWKTLVREYQGRFFAMHLRDGRRPGREVPYLPALPLGSGDEDWPTAIAAASDAGISTFILEMEVEPDLDVFDAIQESLEFLDSSCESNPRTLENAR